MQVRRLAPLPIIALLACAPGEPPEERHEVRAKTAGERPAPPPAAPAPAPPPRPTIDEAAIKASACRVLVNSAVGGSSLSTVDLRIHPQGTAERRITGVSLVDGDGIEVIRRVENAPPGNDWTYYDELVGYRPDDTRRVWLSRAKGPVGKEDREVSRELEVLGAFGSYLSVLEVDMIQQGDMDRTTERPRMLMDGDAFDARTWLTDEHARLAGRGMVASLALDEADEYRAWSRPPRTPRKVADLEGLALELRVAGYGDAETPKYAELVHPEPRDTMYGLYGAIAPAATMIKQVAEEEGELRTRFFYEFPVLPLPEALQPYVPVMGVIMAPNRCAAIDLERREVLAPTDEGWRVVGLLGPSDLDIVGVTFVSDAARFAQSIEMAAGELSVAPARDPGEPAVAIERLPDHAAALKWALPAQGFGIVFP